ncbi:MAG: putative Ig domain-containing protein, partial [Gammaproteobacteria bacterium]|nr:putative Ig domain-containing protein [Gammaproteobacteria bacterium]
MPRLSTDLHEGRNGISTTRRTIALAKHASWLAVAILLAGCGAGASDQADTGSALIANQPPALSGIPQGKITITSGDNFNVQPQANDADGDSLDFSILNKPAWASFDTGTGRLSGRPGATDVGSYSGIVISVTDGIDTTNGNAFEVVVDAAGAPVTNTPPTLSGNPSTSVKSGERYSFLPTASDADGDTLLFSINNRPTWAQFNDQTGELSGIPGVEHVGSYDNIQIGVGDGTTWVYTATFSIQVSTDAPPVQPPPAQNRAPTISGNPASSVTAGQAYRYTPTASDPDGDPLTFSIRGLPACASFDSRTGTLG